MTLWYSCVWRAIFQLLMARRCNHQQKGCWCVHVDLQAGFVYWPGFIQGWIKTHTLWWTNIAMENHHFNGKIHYKWPFSIAMLVHQRVERKQLQWNRGKTAPNMPDMGIWTSYSPSQRSYVHLLQAVVQVHGSGMGLSDAKDALLKSRNSQWDLKCH